MAAVQALMREALRGAPQQIPEANTIVISGIGRATAGIGSVYDDASTTSVTVATGAAATTITVGGGAGWTGGTYGKSGQTETFLGNITMNGTTFTGAGASTTFTTAAHNLTVSTTSSGTIAVTSAGALNLTGTAASTWANSGGALIIQSTSQAMTIQTITSGTLAITSAGALNLTGVAASTFAFSGGAFILQTTSQALTIQTVTSGTLSITGVGTVAVTSVAFNVTASGASTHAYSGGAYILQTTSQNLTVQTLTSGTLAITSAGALNITAASGQDITFNARAGTAYTWNDASNTALNAGFSGVTSVLGALNFLYLTPSANGTLSMTNNNAGTISQGQCVYVAAANKVDLTNAGTEATNSTANFIGVVQAASIATTAAGLIQFSGKALVRIKTGRHVPAINDPLILDVTNNGYGVSVNADAGANPSTAGQVVQEIGSVVDLNGNTAGASLGADATVYVILQKGPKLLV